MDDDPQPVTFRNRSVEKIFPSRESLAPRWASEQGDRTGFAARTSRSGRRDDREPIERRSYRIEGNEGGHPLAPARGPARTGLSATSFGFVLRAYAAQ